MAPRRPKWTARAAEGPAQAAEGAARAQEDAPGRRFTDLGQRAATCHDLHRIDGQRSNQGVVSEQSVGFRGRLGTKRRFQRRIRAMARTLAGSSQRFVHLRALTVNDLVWSGRRRLGTPPRAGVLGGGGVSRRALASGAAAGAEIAEPADP